MAKFENIKINSCQVKSPCVKCEERHFMCHSECQAYLKYKIKYEIAKYQEGMNRKDEYNSRK